MGITPSTLSGTITTSAVKTEIDRARDWLNDGIVVGDIAATSIKRSHLYRPDVYGFPQTGAIGPTQGVWVRQANLSSPATRPGAIDGSLNNLRLFLARAADRTSIFPEYLFDSGSFRIASMAARVEVTTSSVVEISANWEAVAQVNQTNVSPAGSATAPDYPDTAGAFSLYYQEYDGSETVCAGTQRRINSNVYDIGDPILRMNLFNASWVGTLSAGTYDFWLRYDLLSAGTEVEQIILGVRSLKIELFKA